MSDMPPSEPIDRGLSQPHQQPPPQPTTAPASRRGLLVLCGVLLLTTLLFLALFVTARSELTDRIQERDVLKAQINAQESAAAAKPKLMDMAEATLGAYANDEIELSGDADALDVTIVYPGSGEMGALGDFLDELGFPSATVSRMEQTRALDGTLEAQGRNVSVTWTYHPDDGLSLVFSAE